MSLKNIGNIIGAFKSKNSIVDVLKNIGEVEKAGSSLQKISSLPIDKFQLLSQAFPNVGDDAIKAALGIKETASAATEATSHISNLKNGFKGLGASISSFIGAHTFIVSIGAMVATIGLLSAATQDAREKMSQAQTSLGNYEQTNNDLVSLRNELKTIGTQIDELNAKEHLTFTEQSELTNLQAQSNELERQITLKDKLSNIQKEQAARDAAAALDSFSMRDAIDTNGEGIFTNIVDGLKMGSAWLSDKVGLSQSIVGDDMPFDKILSERIDSAKEAQDKLKKLQDSQTDKNYDSVQKKIDKQQKVVDNYLSDVNGLYEELQSYSLSFFDEETGKKNPKFEDEANRFEKVQKKYLDFLGETTEGKDIDKSINGTLNKVKFDGFKDKLAKAGSEGIDALTAALNSGDYDAVINSIADSLDLSKSDAKEKLSDYIMSIADPSALNIKEIQKQLADAFIPDFKDATPDARKNAKQAWEKFTDGMSDEDFEILYSIKQETDTSTWEIDDWKNAFDKAKESSEEMNDSYETLISNANNWMKAIDNVNAALVNSVSGKGLGFEYDTETKNLTGDIINLQNAYQHLDGYDPALLFEKTANGVHLNRDALRQLQAQEEANNKAEFIKKRLDLQNELNTAMSQQQKLSKDSTEWETAQGTIDSLQSQIQNIDLLASAYDGATSAYQKWINAQSAGEEGDMYDAIRDTAIDRGIKLYENGLVGTEEFRAIADLFSYDDLSTAPVEQVVAAYENAAPTIKKFFTDGREGVDGFVESMKTISDANNMGWVDVLEDGTYKFNTGDDDAIARELGIDVEAVQAIYKKLKDYGAEGIQIGDTSGIENYSDRLKELESDAENAKEKLNEMAGTDLKFNFDSQSIDNLSSQIDQANQIVQNLPKNEDGTINVHTDGAQEAITVLQTLIQKREELASNQNVVMRVDAEENESVSMLQDFQHAKDELDTLNQLNVQGIQIDTTEAQNNVDNLMKSVQKIADEHPELELDTSSADALEESLSHLTEDQLLALGIDTSQLDSAKEKLDAIKGMNEFNVSVNVNGEGDINALGNELSSLPPDTPANISVNVQNSSQLDNTVQQLEKVPPDTTANFTFSVQNADEAEALSSKIAELNGERDGDHQITYSMNIVPGDNSAESQIETLTQPKEVNVAVKVSGQEQVTFLQGQLSTLESEKGINVAVNYTKKGEQTPPDEKSAAVNYMPIAYQAPPVNMSAAVNYTLGEQAGPVNKTAIVNYVAVGAVPGSGAVATGTMLSVAHANGTAYNVINTKPVSAYADGKVSLPHDEVALSNEVGQESIVRDGKWNLLPPGIHMQAFKKGDIILNARQTADLLRSGKASGHGKAYANGTVSNVRDLVATSLSNAYSSGSRYTPGKNIGGSGSKSYSSNKSGSTNSSSTPQNTAAVDRNTDSTDENTKSNKSLQDWIEQLISVQKAENGRLYDAIEDFEMHANQNKAIDNYVSDSESYMDTLRQAQNRYMTKANALGVPGNYVHKIWAGELDIEDIQDEDLKEKISQYQTWYEKAKDLGDEIVDINRKIRETKIKKLDNIKDDYENLVSLSESMADYNESVSDLSEKLNLVGDSKALKKSMDMQAAMRAALVNEQKQLTTQLNALVADGTIGKNTDTWNKWQEEINKVKKSIVDCDSALADLKKSILEIRYSKFEQSLDNLDFTGDMASSVRDLMNKEGIYDDDVQLTSTGYAQLALMSTELTSAKQKTVNYQAAINALKKDLKNGNITQAQYNERLQEYQKGQMDAAKSAKSAKDAILDLVKNGIEKQTEAMEKLINKRKEELQKMKEADDYQKNMTDRSKEMNAVKSQLAALEGNDTKEAVAQKKNLNSKLQKLQDEYDEARKDHEYDVISEGYDSQLEKFKENQDAITKELESSTEAQQKAISEVLEATKNQQAVVYEELKAIAGDYQMSLTDSLTKPWADAQAALKQFQDSMSKLNANVSIDTSKIEPTKPSNDKTTPTKNESNKQTVDKSKTGTWLNQDGRWWYQHSDGSYTKNAWEAIDGQWYKFDERGWMQTGWQPWGVDKNGQALWYYMTDNGNMAASTWIDDKYYVDHTGAMVRNGYVKSKNSGLYYWVNGDGVWEPQWNTYTPDLKKYKLYYESGTPKAKDDLAYMDDKNHELKLGSEAIITKNGVLGNFGGSAIFNEKQTAFLHKFSENASIPNVYSPDIHIPKQPDYSKFEVNGGGDTYNVNNHYDSLLNVEGNITKDVFPGVKKMCEESFKYTTRELKEIKKLGGFR